MEGLGQIVARAGHRDMLLLHRLQQRRLSAGRGAVDFVSHQQLREDRTGNETKAALAAGVFFQHFGAENVGRHQVWRELHAAGIHAERNAHGLDQLGLGETGHTNQKRVAAGQDRDQSALDHQVLAEDDGADGFLGRAHMGGGRFRRAHDHILELFQVFTAWRRHDPSFLLSRVFLLPKGYATNAPHRICCGLCGESASLFRRAYAILHRGSGPVTKLRTGAKFLIIVGKQWRRQGRKRASPGWTV